MLDSDEEDCLTHTQESAFAIIVDALGHAVSGAGSDSLGWALASALLPLGTVSQKSGALSSLVNSSRADALPCVGSAVGRVAVGGLGSRLS